jgi:hypothetical protein
MLDRDRRAWVSKLAEGRVEGTQPPAPRFGNDLQPQSSDLVITSIVCHPSVRYTVGRVADRAQLSFATRDQALTFARPFARRHRLTIWECEAGRFTLLGSRASWCHWRGATP